MTPNYKIKFLQTRDEIKVTMTQKKIAISLKRQTKQLINLSAHLLLKSKHQHKKTIETYNASHKRDSEPKGESIGLKKPGRWLRGCPVIIPRKL